MEDFMSLFWSEGRSLPHLLAIWRSLSKASVSTNPSKLTRNIQRIYLAMLRITIKSKLNTVHIQNSGCLIPILALSDSLWTCPRFQKLLMCRLSDQNSWQLSQEPLLPPERFQRPDWTQVYMLNHQVLKLIIQWKPFSLSNLSFNPN